MGLGFQSIGPVQRSLAFVVVDSPLDLCLRAEVKQQADFDLRGL